MSDHRKTGCVWYIDTRDDTDLNKWLADALAELTHESAQYSVQCRRKNGRPEEKKLWEVPDYEFCRAFYNLAKRNKPAIKIRVFRRFGGGLAEEWPFAFGGTPKRAAESAASHTV